MTEQQRIATENIGIWRRAALENRELRTLQLSELAGALPTEPREDEQLQELIATLWPSNGAALTEDAVAEKMALCRAVRPHTASDPAPRVTKAAPRVAMLSGRLFADAFSRFSALIPEAKAVYFSSLGELLEDTASGAAELAILPLEDVKGVRFLHFFEEIDRLELHITHTCDVRSDESEEGTRFALLSRDERPPAPPSAERLLECHLSGEDARELGELLSAAALAGLTLLRIDTRSSPYREESLVFYASFLVGDGDAALFERYLSLFIPRAALLAHYFHLK